MKALIIPDIHGRTFWKEPCEWAVANNIPIIFLGDIFDPYSHEGINEEMAIENGKELLSFIQNNIKLCTVLVGNHDMEYLAYPWFPEGGRHSAKHHDEIKEILSKFPFELAYQQNGILFTHAGISTKYGKVLINSPYWDEDKTPEENLNVIFYKSFEERQAKDIMSYIGYARGGWNECGSCLWADLTETMQCKPFEGLKQIVGHSQLSCDEPVYARRFGDKDHPNLNDIWYADCRHASVLDDDNNLKVWENEN